MKGLIPYLFVLVFSNPGFAQGKKPQTGEKLPEKPSLVVGIVVDQMRYDFLYRYKELYSAGGFRRMLKEGFSFANCHYSYFPTVTGPGHASIFTGTTPAVHGITGNDWFESAENRKKYCAQDDSVQAIGGSDKAGKMSPRNMKTFSVADQVQLAQNFRGKSFGLAMKDRGSILPAGHGANAAFWFDPSNGHFISSTWYKKLNGKLPLWLEEFNQKEYARSFCDSVWKPLLPLSAYVQSSADSTPWEKPIIKGRPPVFPFALSGNKDLGTLVRTPFGNRLTALAAKALIQGERLGKTEQTDFLAVSFSSPDAVGHDCGPFSVESEDTYLRLDRDLEDLFRYLDKEVGKGKYLCFLTADHGVMEVPAFLRSHHLPSLLFRPSVLNDSLKKFCLRNFGSDEIIRTVMNLQVHLNPEPIRRLNLDHKQVVESLVRYIESQPSVSRAFAYEGNPPYPSVPMMEKFEAGYCKGRSGDIQIVLSPGILDSGSDQGTTHGAPYSYDSHVPCVWMGWKVKPGEEVKPMQIQDIAPTLSSLIHIMEPNGCTGKAQPIPLKP